MSTRSETSLASRALLDHGPRAHITAGREGATAAAVHGTPMLTLCGEQLVPMRDPRSVPPCQRCLRILGKLGVEPPDP